MSLDSTNKILVTGAAGFIGFHLVKTLLKSGYEVIGLDNINNYYDPNLKFARLKELGIEKSCAKQENEICKSTNNKFSFIRLNLADKEKLFEIFVKYSFRTVCHLAAQAGVRYSLENPEVYIKSNVVGFLNILECCKALGVEKLLYASSSSVYGNNSKVPFSTEDNVDHPVSLYAATKKSNELMAHTYSHLYNLNTIGLRFFTVYGPWGRPDMAMFLFTDAIIKGKPIKVFNNGELERDFTFIDDIIEGIMQILNNESKGSKKYSLYNIGNSRPVKLLDFIEELERQLGRQAEKIMLPMQPGDVMRTWANIDSLKEDFGYNPKTSMKKGIACFVNWYNTYYGEENLK